jgi:Icc protein
MPDAPEPLRVLHLTDPHLFADSRGELRGVATRASLSRVLDHYAAGDWRADLAVVTGDLVQDDSRAAYENFRNLLSRLGLPVYCVPGNHDVRELMQQALASPPFHYCEAVRAGNWLIACLDSCIEGEVGGRIPERELSRLESDVARTDAAHVMVCVHHPPVPVQSRWLDGVGLANGAEFLARLTAIARVRLAIFGHVHQEYDSEHDGIRILTTPSTCRQFAPRSDEFAVDDRPPAYRRIELHHDGRFTHELVWVDSA